MARDVLTLGQIRIHPGSVSKEQAMKEAAEILESAGAVTTDYFDAMQQREPDEGEGSTDIIVLTHQTLEHRIDTAIARIEALPTVLSAVTRLRVEQLD